MPDSNPIMLHGIMPRSGTNLLHRCLLLHPDCTEHSGPVREGFVLHHSDQLLQYAADVASHWTNPKWNTTDQDRLDLLSEIGEGLLRFLSRQSEPGKRLISKTPSATNIKHGPTLFPNAQFVILIRDGRSVCESTKKSWGAPIQETARKWLENALAIEEFQQAHADICRIVRYEAFLDERIEATRELLEFLGLDCERYPFDQLDSLPILGSSESYKTGWTQAPMRDGFAPQQRWKDWTDRQHARFNEIAGDVMRRFDYDLVPSVKKRFFSGLFGSR